MSSVSMVALEDLPRLICPYCGRSIPPDTPWVSAARERWGWAGVAATVDGVPVGTMLVAPNDDALGSTAAMVMCAWVRPGATRMGVGRHLVQSLGAGLLPRQTRFIAARGSRTHISCAALPREFLRSTGFARGRDDRLWRLDLDQTVVERPSLREVVERLVGVIRPVAPPEPAGRSGAS